MLSRTSAPQTAAELCWCFAAGCLEGRHEARTIDEALYERLHKHLLAGTYPEPQDIRAAFTRPFDAIATKSGTVSIEAMRTYWRSHNTAEHTPVYLGIVSSTCARGSQHWAKVFQLAHGSRWERGWHHNHLRTPLKPGSRVWVHGTIVVNIGLLE